MRTRHIVGSGMVVLLAAVVVTAPVFGGTLPAAGQPQTDDTGEQGAGFGQQISSFAQASAVDANESVASGMWRAAVNDTDDPASAVTGRARMLERRLDRLQNQAAALRSQRENGTISETAYTARASALRVRIANLRTAVDETERTARRVGVDATNLDRLRSMAANVSGPEVAALARNITDAPRGPPEEVPGGPPDDAGPGQNGPPDGAGPANGTGPGQAGNGDSGPGPPDDSGSPGDSGPPDDGPPDDAGDDDTDDSDSDSEGESGDTGNGGDGDNRGDGNDRGGGDGNGGDKGRSGGGNDGDRGPPDE